MSSWPELSLVDANSGAGRGVASAKAFTMLRADADGSTAPPSAAVAAATAYDQARAAGYAQGRSEALQAATEAAADVAAEQARLIQRLEDDRIRALSRAVAAVQAGADSLASRTLPAEEELVALVVDQALALARAIIGKELPTTADLARAAMGRAVAELPATAAVVVRLHPEDAQALAQDDAAAGVRLVADPSVAAGDAVAESGDRSVEARLEHAVTRAVALLSGTDTTWSAQEESR